MFKATQSVVILLCFVIYLKFTLIRAFPMTRILANNDVSTKVNTEQTIDSGVVKSYLQDDILFEMRQEQDLFNPLMEHNMKVKIWPKGEIYYQIGPEYEKTHVKFIQLTMASIESKTCIRFIPATDQINSSNGYVNITAKDQGCFASIGYRRNIQILNLEIFPLHSGCFQFGTIVHELIHVLGFIHQQCIPSRDEYVKIVKENIRNEMLVNFNKFPVSYIGSIGLPYDYNSIMHYHSKAFSKNGKNTIEPYKSNVRIGQRKGMSAKDITKILDLYKCKTIFN